MDLTTIGVKFGWAVETTAGVKPTAFKQLLNCKAIDGIKIETDTVDVTPLEAALKRYAKGLGDTGGKWGVTFGMNDDFETAWGECMAAYTAAKASGLSTWFVVWVPGMTNAFYVVAEPGSLPMPEFGNSAPLEVQTSNTINDYKGLLTAIEPTEVSSLSGLTVVSVAGSAAGKTKIYVNPALVGTDTYVYKTAASVSLPVAGQDLTTWTALTVGTDITATTGYDIVVAEVTATTKLAVKAGKAIVTSLA